MPVRVRVCAGGGGGWCHLGAWEQGALPGAGTRHAHAPQKRRLFGCERAVWVLCHQEHCPALHHEHPGGGPAVSPTTLALLVPWEGSAPEMPPARHSWAATPRSLLPGAG